MENPKSKSKAYPSFDQFTKVQKARDLTVAPSVLSFLSPWVSLQKERKVQVEEQLKNKLKRQDPLLLIHFPQKILKIS